MGSKESHLWTANLRCAGILSLCQAIAQGCRETGYSFILCQKAQRAVVQVRKQTEGGRNYQKQNQSASKQGGEHNIKLKINTLTQTDFPELVLQNTHSCGHFPSKFFQENLKKKRVGR